MLRFELNKGGSRIRIEKILKKLEKTVSEEFKKSGVISVAFAGRKKMREWNRKYRRKDKAADILTFIFNEGGFLGEIILCSGGARKGEKIVRLIIHGVCHIFGYGHKKNKDAAKMEKKEKKLLEKFYGR